MPKRAIDIIRDEFAQRAMRRRAALSGPFVCPKCLTDGKLECQTTSKNVKEDYTPPGGETRKLVVPYIHYLFSCRACRFRRVIVRDVSGLTPSIIDVYNNLFDEEISAVNREGQLALFRDRKPRVITLPATEVRMK